MSSDTAVLEITVNGERRTAPAGATLAQLLAALGTPSEGIAVERNGRIVRRAELASVRVEAGDRIEVVTFVGGG